MDKRGSHADWAISMGIFLIYLLVLFIIIRPGVEPIHNEDTLLDIVESKFNKDVKWVVKMTPLVVDLCKPDERGDPSSATVEDTVKPSWKFTGIKLKVISGDEIREELVPDAICINDGSTVVLISGGTERYCEYVSDKIFNLYYVPDKSKYTNPLLELVLKGECKAKLGSSEEFIGINSIKLDDLIFEAKRDYEKLKSGWDFPKSSYFSIFIDGERVIGEKPYENSNVYVREWKDWYVKDNGERREVKVSINIW